MAQKAPSEWPHFGVGFGTGFGPPFGPKNAKLLKFLKFVDFGVFGGFGGFGHLEQDLRISGSQDSLDGSQDLRMCSSGGILLT